MGGGGAWKSKTTEALKKQYVAPPPAAPSFSLVLSRAAYYSVLIYKALNVILHVQVKGRRENGKSSGVGGGAERNR